MVGGNTGRRLDDVKIGPLPATGSNRIAIRFARPVTLPRSTSMSQCRWLRDSISSNDVRFGIDRMHLRLEALLNLPREEMKATAS